MGNTEVVISAFGLWNLTKYSTSTFLTGSFVMEMQLLLVPNLIS